MSPTLQWGNQGLNELAKSHQLIKGDARRPGPAHDVPGTPCQTQVTLCVSKRLEASPGPALGSSGEDDVRPISVSSADAASPWGTWRGAAGRQSRPVAGFTLEEMTLHPAGSMGLPRLSLHGPRDPR